MNNSCLWSLISDDDDGCKPHVQRAGEAENKEGLISRCLSLLDA